MGEASAAAQGLNHVITSYDKLATSSHTLYLYMLPEERRVAGLLKVGHKRLFIMDGIRGTVEMEPLCALDFYVHESMQRRGIGLALFETMLSDCRAVPARMGYDRPSDKFLSFLAKHYGLRSYTPQSNNFVVFHDYFDPPRTVAVASAANAGPSTGLYSGEHAPSSLTSSHSTVLPTASYQLYGGSVPPPSTTPSASAYTPPASPPTPPRASTACDDQEYGYAGHASTPTATTPYTGEYHTPSASAADGLHTPADVYYTPSARTPRLRRHRQPAPPRIARR
ncbi:uncharacterized protein AMSG_04228 [Thecamonas trahens ATCC 50062]|uniref:N-acetyltransferase domain-containing protein n=1 Tax=Thecamonas trahens ATCC 50062 TaxID=461836 RepID=A0A0L0D9M3_THETB|nr:hypothetical protein AMSG_04228 [Thecamonas trahens ATCC 50062]KNC47993.1 hypothetical protein AMSG_04228 [Thecamonas trahens ATCC 50062]|eukprot:XP_013759010.1 hypothetical protein AMSG_04228 [Thecamonas trahens ATCC 50062]